MSADEHFVDILEPPQYVPSGRTQPIVRAIRSGDWLHVTNLWLYRTAPRLQILFQQRDLKSPVFSGLLDCSVAGYLEAGESGVDGAIRETQEELGITFAPDELQPFGRHFNAGLDHRGRERKWVINEYISQWEHELRDVTIAHHEVPAVFWIDVDDVLKVENGGSIAIVGLAADKSVVKRTVARADFVPNVDEYHFRMAARIKELILSYETHIQLNYTRKV